MQNALIALRHVNFDWTAHIDEIWVDQQHETERLQDAIRSELQDALETLKNNRKEASPLGIPLLGPAGSGKTHLLGFLRRQALAQGMYFILADMTDVADFWETVSLGYLRSLQQHSDGRRQVDRWLDRMIELYGQGNRKAKDIPKQRPPALINRTAELIDQVRAKHRKETQEHVDVLRALILFACDHADVNDLGYKWLQGLVIDDEELGVFGFQQKHQMPSRIVRGLSWLLSLTGPSVLALDQLDAIVAEHELSRSELDADTPSDEQRRSLAIIQGIAGGLLGLRDLTRRTLCVVSSLEATWNILHSQATVSMADRYDSTLLLRPGTGPDVFRELVIGRLNPSYQENGFRPPYPAYPFSEAFFEKYRDNTPRELLKACEAHRKACRNANAVTETGSDRKIIEDPPEPQDDRWKVTVASRIEALSAQADVAALLADDSENLQDRVVEAACCALLLENPMPEHVFAKVEKDFMGTGSYDPLHARIRLLLTHQRERELHQSFRFLEKYHPRAFQARLKAALTASGIDRDLHFRGLTILRASPTPSGAATEKLVTELQARGGRIVTPSERELGLLLALEESLRKNDLDRLGDWLALERPVSKMACFASAVSSLLAVLEARTSEPPPAAEPSDEPEAPPRPEPVAVPGGGAAHVGPVIPAPQPTRAESEKPSVRVLAPSSILPIGRRLVANEPQDEVGIALERLPYHTCVFAGSGSGKTVFLKRVIEEAALLGIPSIVLDGANDLSRLGATWPERPAGFSDADAQKAHRYHEQAEVVVWTPGAPKGNPMRLSPLPDFTAISADPEERAEELRAAVEIATTSIGDMIVKGSAGAAAKQTAILKATLRHFSRRGGTIQDFVRFLREPPDDVIEPYEKGDRIARELSELLHAETENDPLVGGSGTALDPSLLFRAITPGKTRVSVLNLVGLASYDRKRRFVDQLAATLFSWVKKNPAPAGGLLGLVVIDEAKDFVPSGKSVPGKENLIRLAAQARKYGLGLLFATQEPKSIEHSIVSNCSTLLAGKMASPAAIDALQQLLSDKGTRATDVGTLKRGTFYFGSASDRPVKIATSLCLSYHPSTPPSEAEVLDAARRSAPH
jgi:DNA helicase HerA-like ATPase